MVKTLNTEVTSSVTGVTVIYVLRCTPREAEQVVPLLVGRRLVICKDRYCKRFTRGKIWAAPGVGNLFRMFSLFSSSQTAGKGRARN